MWVTSASGLDIDHMGPLAEVWDSGASGWSAPAAEVHCRYVAEWVGTKLRWTLSADEAEVAALREVAAGCPGQTVAFESAA